MYFDKLLFIWILRELLYGLAVGPWWIYESNDLPALYYYLLFGNYLGCYLPHLLYQTNGYFGEIYVLEKEILGNVFIFLIHYFYVLVLILLPMFSYWYMFIEFSLPGISLNFGFYFPLPTSLSSTIIDVLINLYCILINYYLFGF